MGAQPMQHHTPGLRGSGTADTLSGGGIPRIAGALWKPFDLQTRKSVVQTLLRTG